MNDSEKNDDVITLVELLDVENNYSLRQLCEICQVTETEVLGFVEYNVIDPDVSNEWVFRQNHLDRVSKGVRLQRDLELNHAGVALALDLLETIERLKREVGMLRIRSGIIE